MKHSFRYPSADGVTEINAAEWLPDGQPKAIVQLVHGVAEYIDRYDELAGIFTEAGYLVAANDHLGHGKSLQPGEEPGWFGEQKGWSTLVRDMKTLYERETTDYPGLPVILYGHSMGSFLARTYLFEYPEDATAAVLSGTGHQNGLVCLAGRAAAGAEIALHGTKYRSRLLQSMAFGSYLKGIENPSSPNAWISRDEEVLRRYDADPLCGFVATAGLMRDMMDGLDRIRRMENIARMRKDLPILLVSGEADPVGAWGKGVRAVGERMERAGLTDVSVRLYPGGRHEMHNEINREEFYRDVLQWMDSRLPPRAE